MEKLTRLTVIVGMILITLTTQGQDCWESSEREAYIRTNPPLPSSTGHANGFAWNGAHYGLAWVDREAPAFTASVAFAIMQPDGTLHPPYLIPPGDRTTPAYPRVWWNESAEEWLVIWRDNGEHAPGAARSSNIFLARFDGTGNSIGAVVALTDDSVEPNYFDAAWTGSQLGIVWQDATSVRYQLAEIDGSTAVRPIQLAFGGAREVAVVWTGTEFAAAIAGFSQVDAVTFPTNGAPVTTTTVTTFGADEVDLAWTGRELGVIWRDNASIRMATIENGNLSVVGQLSEQDAEGPTIAWSGTTYMTMWSRVGAELVRREVPPGATALNLQPPQVVAGGGEDPTLLWADAHFAALYVGGINLIWAEISDACSSISGTVYRFQRQRRHRSRRTGLSGVVIDLFRDPNGNGDPFANDIDGNPGPPILSVVTDANGDYSFRGLLPDTYGIQQFDLQNYLSSNDSDGVNDNRILIELLAAVHSTGNNFLDFLIFGSISGAVIDDLDRNGLVDEGEPGLSRSHGMPAAPRPLTASATTACSPRSHSSQPGTR